jgi:hypothetical protein
MIDRMIGGVGLRRGRRHPREIRSGDALDFCRVVEVMPPHRLLLAAEMLTPGDALLEFQVIGHDGNHVELRMLSRFLPKGIFGIVYWYALYPIHKYVFHGMLKGIARSVNRPIVTGPERFSPRLHSVCSLTRP